MNLAPFKNARGPCFLSPNSTSVTHRDYFLSAAKPPLHPSLPAVQETVD